jgi:hypothetical protein
MRDSEQSSTRQDKRRVDSFAVEPKGLSTFVRCGSDFGTSLGCSAEHSRHLRATRLCRCVPEILPRITDLPQLRVLGFGLLQDGDVRVGVFPQSEEVVVGGECPDAGGIDIRPLRGSQLQGVRASHAQAR